MQIPISLSVIIFHIYIYMRFYTTTCRKIPHFHLLRNNRLPSRYIFLMKRRTVLHWIGYIIRRIPTEISNFQTCRIMVGQQVNRTVGTIRLIWMRSSGISKDIELIRFYPSTLQGRCSRSQYIILRYILILRILNDHSHIKSVFFLIQ